MSIEVYKFKEKKPFVPTSEKDYRFITSLGKVACNLCCTWYPSLYHWGRHIKRCKGHIDAISMITTDNIHEYKIREKRRLLFNKEQHFYASELDKYFYKDLRFLITSFITY